MSDAPERIWVCTQTIGANLYPVEECPKQAGWTHVSSAPDGCATEYVRAAALTAQAAEIERLLEALEPSGSTKYAYSGEFEFTQVASDEDGDEVYHGVTVPWTTIKEIMAAISARANYKEPTS